MIPGQSRCRSAPQHLPSRKGLSKALPPIFPSSASGPRPGAWRPSRPFFPACPQTPIQAWLSSWCNTWPRTTKASLQTSSSATPACRSSRWRTGWLCAPTAPTSSRRAGTWLFWAALSNCWSLPLPGAGGCPSTFSFGHWPRISASEPSALCFRAPAPMARSACAPSRARAEWSWPRTLLQPRTTACRAAPLPPAWWTMSFRRPRWRPGLSPMRPTLSEYPAALPLPRRPKSKTR